MDQKDEASSSEKRIPPTGAPKAAATPAAHPPDTKSRLKSAVTAVQSWAPASARKMCGRTIGTEDFQVVVLEDGGEFREVRPVGCKARAYVDHRAFFADRQACGDGEHDADALDHQSLEPNGFRCSWHAQNERGKRNGGCVGRLRTEAGVDRVPTAHRESTGVARRAGRGAGLRAHLAPLR